MEKNVMGKGPQITPDLLKSSQTIACYCGGMIFSEKLFFKKISALMSPSGREEGIPIPIIVCEKCGKVPEAFDSMDILPEEIKSKKSDLLTKNK